MTKIKKKISHQDIYINGKLITEHNPIVPKGSFIEIRRTKRLSNAGFPILYEDQDIIAVEKPAGILTCQSSRDRDDTLHGKVNQYLRRGVRIVHRLDQHVSGVVLFAKTIKGECYLTRHWSDFEKTYHAVVEGCPDPVSGTLESWLYEDRNYKVHSGKKRPGSKLAVTHYRVEKRFRQFTLLSVELGTGKKNQIRVQLAEIGCHIVGDVKYGATTNPFGRIGLHARTLAFTHPTTGKKITLQSPAPFSFLQLR